MKKRYMESRRRKRSRRAEALQSVADEACKLSDSTAKSTKDITVLIEEIQHEISNAIISMEQSTKSVDAGR